MTEQAEIQQAIAVLEAQRQILGDSVVDTAIAPMRDKIIALEQIGREADSGSAGEHKLVTILFADVVGSTAISEQLDSEMARLVMDRCLREISQAVDEFGGTIARLMGDGLLAFFGAPVAHEDDPERAVMAAGRIHQNIAALNSELGRSLQVRVGVNTGRVVLGEMGGEIRSEYTAIGSPVNLAARLEGVAEPGRTLLGETTARMVSHRFDIIPLEPLSLKGFSHLVPAYELLGERSEPESQRGIRGLQSPLVGRDSEQNELQILVKHLEEGRGGIASLIGEPGIGKSRLIGELKETYADRVVDWAEGRAYSYRENQPHGVILDLFNELLDLAADDTPELLDLKLEHTLNSLFGGRVGEVWPYLAVLLGAPVPPQYDRVVNRLDAETLNIKIASSVCQFMEALAKRRPLVVVFEDLHWADHSSVRLIESLLLSTVRAPLLIVFIFRPEREKPCWNLKLKAETEYADHYVELSLVSLSDGDSQTLVENLLQVAEFPDSLRDLIQEKAEGNPFFVEELIRDLIEAQVLTRRNEKWVLEAEVTRLTVPNTVQEVIQARLDRLPERTRWILQGASVIGRRFAYRVLKAIVPQIGPNKAREQQNLPEQMVRLQQADLVSEYRHQPDLEYMFKHVVVQETAYGTMLSGQRRELHRQVAETLERLFPHRREELFGALARHYAAAGESVQAIKYFLEAARRGQAVYAYKEAQQFLKSALKLCETDSELLENRMELLEKLADICSLLAERAEAIQLYQEALDLNQSLADGDKWTIVRLHRKLGETWISLWSFDDRESFETQALSSLEAGLKLTEAEPPHPETVLLLVTVSKSPPWKPDWEMAERYARAALEMAEELDTPYELSAALGRIADVYGARRRYRERVKVAQRRLTLSRDTDFADLREQLNILTETAGALRGVGRYAQAIALLIEAEAIGVQIQDIDDQVYPLQAKVHCWLRLDRWDNILKTEEKMEILFKRYSLERHAAICWYSGFTASVHSLRGEYERARQLQERSYEIMIGVSGSEDHWIREHHY